jgi:hypothetical protein
MEIIQSRLPFISSHSEAINSPRSKQHQQGTANCEQNGVPSLDVYESVPVDSSKLLLTLPAANLLASKRLQDLKAKMSVQGIGSQSIQPLTVEVVPDVGEIVAQTTTSHVDELAKTASPHVGELLVSLEVTRGGAAATRNFQLRNSLQSGACFGSIGTADAALGSGGGPSRSLELDSDTESDAEAALEPPKKVLRHQLEASDVKLRVATRSIALDD